MNEIIKKFITDDTMFKLKQIECIETKKKVIWYLQNADFDNLPSDELNWNDKIDLYLQDIENILQPIRLKEKQDMKYRQYHREQDSLQERIRNCQDESESRKLIQQFEKNKRQYNGSGW